MNILENIKRIRTEKKITQAEISEKLGLAQNNYGNIERGVTELTITRLIEIADALNVSIYELLEVGKISDELDNKLEELQKNHQELLQKNATLSSIINDKNLIIEFLQNKVGKANSIISLLFNGLIFSVIEDNNIGYEVEDKEYSSKYAIALKRILSKDDYVLVYNKLDELTNQGELKQLVDYVIENELGYSEYFKNLKEVVNNMKNLNFTTQISNK